jgi:hypothetical protein
MWYFTTHPKRRIPMNIVVKVQHLVGKHVLMLSIADMTG